MFDEPNDNPGAHDRAVDPARRAQEKADEFRIQAEICAVFEGPRKFNAEINASLDGDLAREIQKRMARLEKAKPAESPVLPAGLSDDAKKLLRFHEGRELTTGDYHIHRRPGEAMIVRWLAGDEVDTFYERAQAHFDAAMEGFREEERQALSWKKDPKTLAYLDALDKLEVKLADRLLRDAIRKHKVFVLSTLTADEIDILFLSEQAMGVAAAELVGAAAAPPDEPSERDRAWFFKLFALRGIVEEVERMCFFTFLQKAEDTFDM